MVKANLELGKLKIQIEGTSEEVSEILEEVKEMEERKKAREERMKLWKERRDKFMSERNERVHNSKKSLTETITQLIKNGYFDESKTAREVLIRLEKVGVHVPSTTLHPILARFVMKDTLKRERNKSEVWEYKKV